MPSWSRPVLPALRPFVLSWVGYDYRLAPDAVHHGVPSTGMTVVLAINEPVDCGWLTGVSRGRFDALVAGLHTRPALVRTHGRQHGLQLSLSPLGSRALLGLPAGALAGEMVEASDVGWPRQLVDRLRDVSWRQRFTLVEEFLLARLSSARADCRAEVAHAWTMICRAHGAVSVQHLAASTGLSRRRLATLVSQELGLAPKQAARVARFEHAQALLGSGHPLSEVAALAGYSDQSHLNREWKTLTGMTPTESLDDFPIIQDSYRPIGETGA